MGHVFAATTSPNLTPVDESGFLSYFNSRIFKTFAIPIEYLSRSEQSISIYWSSV